MSYYCYLSNFNSKSAHNNQGFMADFEIDNILKVSDNSMILRVILLWIYSFVRHRAILEVDTKVRSISLWKHLFFMSLDFHLGCLKDRNY